MRLQDDRKTYQCERRRIPRPEGEEPEGRHLGHCASEQSASFTATPVATSRFVHAALTGDAFCHTKAMFALQKKSLYS